MTKIEMTNEEAIELIYDIQTDAVYNILPDEKEALEMAIKALKQQPCEDCISRTETLKAFAEKCGGECGCCVYNGSGYDTAENCKLIKSMPSVTPKAQNALEEDKRRCENCIHFILRDSVGVVLCGCESWECDYKSKKGGKK